MKTKFIVLKIICLFLFGSSTFAQTNENKNVVFIEYFTRSNEHVDPFFVETLRNKIIDEMNKLQRIQLVDVHAKRELKLEGVRRSQVDSIDNEARRNALMKKMGARFIIKGHVFAMDTMKKDEDKLNIFHEGKIAYTIQLMEVMNDSIRVINDAVYQEVLAGGVGKSSDDALLSTMSSVNMNDFLNSYFPVVTETKATSFNVLEDSQSTPASIQEF
ncbi:MAG: hypothetical protein LUH22_14810 [Bacteroides sp.]|nr:hypothetical protein [Bacteroides sp.]